MTDEILPSLPVETPLGYFSYQIVFWTTMSAVLVAILGWWLGRRLSCVPGRRQVTAELFVGFFDSLCKDILGPNRGRKYLALFGSLFLLMIVCNCIALAPFPRIEIGGEAYVDYDDNGAWEPGEPVADENGKPDWSRKDRKVGVLIPAVREPTANVNVPIGISLFLAAGMYSAALILRGLKGVPGFLFEPYWWMFPLNLIGAVASIVSVSFRLFGNIFGTAVITIIVSYYMASIVFPIPLNLVLGLGFGIIQAFVFTMLWITYHSDLVAEEG
ncbi:MAG: FoF1 ATP synthase subunit A [Planctomycetota bacterium]|jgi:F-type H+-transporting ATPase subunit a